MLTSSTIQETAGTQANDTKNDQASLLQLLTTESQNERSEERRVGKECVP